MKDKEIIDSYQLFLEYAGMTQDEFIHFGLSHVLYADADKAYAQWLEMKEKFKAGAFKIRPFGSGQKNTDSIRALYEFVFSSLKPDITVDTSNNKSARNVALKYIENTNLRINYQCAHIWGCTKNPILFHGVFNLCFIPKIMDPLTGHEAKGTLKEQFNRLFLQQSYDQFSFIIDEYNQLIDDYEVQLKIQDYLDNPDITVTSQFRKQAIDNWAKIVRPD